MAEVDTTSTLPEEASLPTETLPPSTETAPTLSSSATNPPFIPQEAPITFDYAPFAPKAKKQDPAASLLPEDTEFLLAKSFLTAKSKHHPSVYDHLTDVVMHLLETRPHDATGKLEAISAQLKRNRFQSANPTAPTTLKKAVPSSNQIELFKKQISLFQRPSSEDASEKADVGEIPDIMDLANLFEWAGISLGKEETFATFLSIKKLLEEKPLKSVRLWGKLFGTKANYIVVEGEIKEGANDEDDAIANPSASSPSEETAKDGKKKEEGAPAKEKEDEDAPDAPKPKNKAFLPLSREARSGVNRYVYYVASYPGAPWIRLPDVIPEKLQISRKIYKYLTGDLKTPIVSYPPFDATEAQYLRCLIARISSATVLSPNGYYTVDSEEAENEDGNGSPTIIINPEFEGMTNDQLVNLSNWVHHVPYILPQGRVTWEQPKAIKEAKEAQDEEEHDEDEEGDDTENEVVEPETGPAPLSPITADEEHGDISAWSSRMLSPLSPSKFSPVALRSNRWPGATVVAYNDKFANIYVGYGLKDLGNPPKFVAPLLGEIQQEFASGNGDDEAQQGLQALLVEQVDPTVDQEKAYEDEKRAKDNEGKDGSENGDENEDDEDGE